MLPILRMLGFPNFINKAECGDVSGWWKDDNLIDNHAKIHCLSVRKFCFRLWKGHQLCLVLYLVDDVALEQA